MGAAGRTLVDGSSHGSLEACFASARRHATRFGAAPIKINLREPDQAVLSIGPLVPAAQRDAMIVNIDHERARREALRTRAYTAPAEAPPFPITALPTG